MNVNQTNRNPKRKFSDEEKRNYCSAWEKSDLNRMAFCKARGISRSALYQWTKEFEKEEKVSCFAPLVLDKPDPIDQADMIQLKVSLPNKIHLKLTMPKYCLASFIKDIGYETTVIR